MVANLHVVRLGAMNDSDIAREKVLIKQIEDIGGSKIKSTIPTPPKFLPKETVENIPISSARVKLNTLDRGTASEWQKEGIKPVLLEMPIFFNHRNAIEALQ